MRRRQRGMTFIGLLIILALCGVIVYAAIRLVPVYLNYMKIARTMDSVATEFKDSTIDQSSIRNSLARHWEIEDISSVDYNDVTIVRNENGISLHVAYDDKVPYVANISLDVAFDKTVQIQ